MPSFAPLIILILICVITLLNANKNAQKGKNQPPRHEQPPVQPAHEEKLPSQAGLVEGASVRERTLQPSVHFSAHDDSVYQGSMNAITGEGEDPCHEEQLSSLTVAEALPRAAADAEEVAAAPIAEPSPAFALRWNSNEVVRGFVMSEILQRKSR